MAERMERAGATLLGAAAAGVLLWLAAQIGQRAAPAATGRLRDRRSGGLVFALSQLRGRTGHPPGMFLLGFAAGARRRRLGAARDAAARRTGSARTCSAGRATSVFADVVQRRRHLGSACWRSGSATRSALSLEPAPGAAPRRSSPRGCDRTTASRPTSRWPRSGARSQRTGRQRRRPWSASRQTNLRRVGHRQLARESLAEVDGRRPSTSVRPASSGTSSAGPNAITSVGAAAPSAARATGRVAVADDRDLTVRREVLVERDEQPAERRRRARRARRARGAAPRRRAARARRRPRCAPSRSST